jgi:hypothetical protein
VNHELGNVGGYSGTEVALGILRWIPKLALVSEACFPSSSFPELTLGIRATFTSRAPLSSRVWDLVQGPPHGIVVHSKP